MQIGIVGLGRMGGNMARRLARSGVEVIGFDEDAKALVALAGEGVVEPAPVMSLALPPSPSSRQRHPKWSCG